MRCLVRVLKAFRTYNFRHLGALGLKMMLKRDVAAATGAAGTANENAAQAAAQVCERTLTHPVHVHTNTPSQYQHQHPLQ